MPETDENGNLGCVQRWLEDSDLDKIMQNYDANNDGEPICASTTCSGRALLSECSGVYELLSWMESWQC